MKKMTKKSNKIFTSLILFTILFLCNGYVLGAEIAATRVSREIEDAFAEYDKDFAEYRANSKIINDPNYVSNYFGNQYYVDQERVNKRNQFFDQISNEQAMSWFNEMFNSAGQTTGTTGIWGSYLREEVEKRVDEGIYIVTEYDQRTGNIANVSLKENVENEKDKKNEMLNYNSDEIIQYLKDNNWTVPTDEQVKDKWSNVLENDGLSGERLKAWRTLNPYWNMSQGEIMNGTSNTTINEDQSTGIDGTEERNKTIDEIVSDANDFVKPQDLSNTVNQNAFDEGISKIYNILFAIGMIITVIWGVVLGIKFLYASADGQAKIKEQLFPYIIGVFVIFGAFGIWKIVLEVMKIMG